MRIYIRYKCGAVLRSFREWDRHVCKKEAETVKVKKTIPNRISLPNQPARGKRDE